MARIGRVVATFSAYEHELLRAIIGMHCPNGNLDQAPEGFLNRFTKIAECGFKQRMKHFSSEYKSRWAEDEFILDFDKQMEYAVKIRDQFAHGVWGKLSDGNLECVFFSREAIRKGHIEQRMVFDAEGLDFLAKTNIDNAVRVMKVCGSD
ncbi:hypothetical protein [Pelagimonas sp. KU-00592-HH]|uniref:hypothetical protein n=1 Tax=Pelagimonas sp. KU-00592-HH TaxID=3127651 RepID=UPI00334282B0